MNNTSFFSTTVGRFVISLGFAVGSLVVAQVATFVTNNPGLFSPIALLLVNALLFAGKNFFDPKIKNLP